MGKQILTSWQKPGYTEEDEPVRPKKKPKNAEERRIEFYMHPGTMEYIDKDDYKKPKNWWQMW